MGINEFTTEEEYLSLMHTGALLNPRLDSTFKALFTQATEESRNALKSFLEAATEQKIASFELAPNDAPTEFSGQRGISYDILCTFDDGTAADIEMQSFNQEYDYGKRAEYQVARLETTYLKKGDNWEKAPMVFQITVLDFIYNKNNNKAVSRYAMRTPDGDELSNALNIIFIELPKAKLLEQNLDENTLLENWTIFLKEADNQEKKDLILKLTAKEDGLMQAQKSLSSISANRDLWIAQYRQEIADRDKRSSISAAIQKGRAEGIQSEKAETVKRLADMGLTEKQIAQAVNLPEEEVRKFL